MSCRRVPRLRKRWTASPLSEWSLRTRPPPDSKRKGRKAERPTVLPWLQRAIHEPYSMSKYDVERLGGTFTPQMAEIP